MKLFLLTFFGIYGALQAYVFWKIQAAFRFKGWRLIGLIAFMALMTLAPALAHRLDRGEWFRTAQAAALLAYYSMAVTMWAVCFGLTLDLWNPLVRIVARTEPLRRRFALSARGKLLVLAAVIVALTTWGVIEAGAIRTETIIIRSPRLKPGSKPIRIVQITDLHLGLLVRGRRLRHIVKLVRQAHPDILVCTGDLLESVGPHMAELVKPLADLKPPLGKFAVTGNHESYARLDKSLDFFKACGFRTLRCESVSVAGGLRLVGVDDPAARRWGHQPQVNEDHVLPQTRPDGFTVLLKHRPEVLTSALGRFDLQLSGHTHGGQVFPFTLLSSLAHKRRNGFHRLPGDSAIYVSRGAGTWGPPLRVFAPPEITLIIIKPAGLPATPVSSG